MIPSPVAIALVVGLFILAILATCKWIPDWFENKKQARMEPEARARRQRINDLADWPRNQYVAIVDLQDEIKKLKAQLAEREPRLTR